MNRIPRPYGLTIKAIHLNKENNNKEIIKLELEQFILNHYLLNDYKLNDTYLTYNQLALYLNLPIDILMQRILEIQNRYNKIQNIEGLNSKTSAIIFSHFQKTAEVHQMAHIQASMLMAQQGGNYVPFLTTEANKAISNLTALLKPQQEFAKMMIDYIKDNKPDIPKDAEQYVTIDSIAEIINTKMGSMLTNEALFLEVVDGLKGLPNVNAKTQNLTDIGIRHNGTSLPESLPCNIPEKVPDTSKEAPLDFKDFLT